MRCEGVVTKKKNIIISSGCADNAYSRESYDSSHGLACFLVQEGLCPIMFLLMSWSAHQKISDKNESCQETQCTENGSVVHEIFRNALDRCQRQSTDDTKENNTQAKQKEFLQQQKIMQII